MGLTHSFDRNIIPKNMTQAPLLDIQKEVTFSLIEVKKEHKFPIVSSDFFDDHENKKIKPKYNNQSSVDAPASVHKTNKIKVKVTNQN